ncbi:MAG: restriction endonuclease subunit S, partial [Bacteroidota bacterium]
MAGEWRLGEVAEIIMGQSPPGETYNELGEGLPFFQGVADFNYRFPTPRVYCTEPSRIAKPGDILLSVRAPIGRVNIADRECAIGRGLCIIRASNPEDARYLEFVLRAKESQWDAIEGSGSVFGNATRRDLEMLPIPWPRETAQRRAIAHILGTLDDKIELNRRMNETLEHIAQAIFKSWFIDATRDGLPEGWRVTKLGEIADVNWGDTNVTKKSYVDKGYLAYSAKGPDGFLSYYDYDRAGVVVSAIGANSGYTWLARGKWSCIKNTIRFWATVPDISTEYLFFATRGDKIWPLRGSAQPFISQTDARNLSVVYPANGLAKRFGEIIAPMFDKIEYNK